MQIWEASKIAVIKMPSAQIWQPILPTAASQSTRPSSLLSNQIWPQKLMVVASRQQTRLQRKFSNPRLRKLQQL